MSQTSDFDLSIVGGGIVGGILACLLAQNDFKIALIDSNPSTHSSDPEKTDPRVFAITRASEQIFRAAGIWEEIQQSPMGHFREMEVWDANGTGAIQFNSQSLCEPTLGYIIENRIIQNAINNKLATFTDVICYRPAALEQLAIHTYHAEAILDNGTRIRAKLIVGADGANSSVRELAGIESSNHDYQQMALVCTVKSQMAHHDIARQCFLDSGPLAFLPLAEPHSCSIVWSTTHEHAQQLIALSGKEFHRVLEDAFDSTFGAVIETGQRFTFPLNRAHAKNYVENRIALIGDAAHRVHPLAGQGANLGILDAASLTEVLTQFKDRDIGLSAILRKYELWRKGENLSVLMAMDAFKHLFGSHHSSIRKLRNMGLNTTNSLPVIKRLIMLRAMGLSGDLPKVAQIPYFL